MAKHTLHDRLCAGLKALGWTQVQFPRSRFTEFARPGTNRKMFIGPAGAFRIGECATRSFDMSTAPLYKDCLALGDKALDPVGEYKF